MTKEKAKQIAEVLNAYAEGKQIEVLLDGEWSEITPDNYFFDIEILSVSLVYTIYIRAPLKTLFEGKSA